MKISAVFMNFNIPLSTPIYLLLFSKRILRPYFRSSGGYRNRMWNRVAHCSWNLNFRSCNRLLHIQCMCLHSLSLFSLFLFLSLGNFHNGPEASIPRNRLPEAINFLKYHLFPKLMNSRGGKARFFAADSPRTPPQLFLKVDKKQLGRKTLKTGISHCR
jgi:hypothetical protein